MIAELSKLGQTDLYKYENSLEIYRDLKGVIDTAFDEGKIEVARSLKSMGIELNIIIQVTGLSEEEISKL